MINRSAEKQEIIDEALISNGFWQFICHKGDVSAPSSFVKVNSFRNEIVCFNDQHTLRAFDNLCPHRGSVIYRENRGKQAFRCRYHGWAFRDGEVRVPRKEEYDFVQPPQINEFEIGFCGDFVFANCGSSINLQSFLTPTLFERLEVLSSEFADFFDCFEVVADSPWPVIVENALEPLHLPFVHSDTLHQLGLSNPDDLFFGLHNCVNLEVTNKRVIRLIKSIRGNGAPLNYYSYFLFPNTFISSTGGIAFSVQTIAPTTRESCTLVSTQYQSKSLMKSSGIDKFLQDTSRFNRKVFEEDVNICSGIDTNRWLHSIRNGFVNKTEAKIFHFRECLKTTANLKRALD